MPRVAVIMPAYRAAATLRTAVSSVLRQPFPDWELTLVDDASDDATGTIAAELAARDPRIRVLTQPKNSGAAAAMNRAWRAADAPWVAILDADDAALAPRLAAPLDFLQTNPGVSVVGGAAHFVNAQGGYWRTVRPPEDHASLWRSRWLASPFLHPTVTMRRSFLEATGGYQDGLRLGEDYDLWMRGFAAGFRYANLPTPLTIYRTRRVQRWRMIVAGARVRWRTGKREGQRATGAGFAAWIIANGLLEQTRIFSLRDRLRERLGGSQPCPREVSEAGLQR